MTLYLSLGGLFVAVALLTAGVVTGSVGRTQLVRTSTQARAALVGLADHVADGERSDWADARRRPGGGHSTVPNDVRPASPGPYAASAGLDQTPGSNERSERILDAVVPASFMAADGLYNWLTPDPAAVQALEHMSGQDIDGALDFHRTFSEGDYQWWTDGSLNAWRGHVGEHQIVEQVESWAGAGSVEMPDASNFAGADLSIFGSDYQVKFSGDFGDIDNKHGDVLIVPEDTVGVPADALHLDFSQPFDAADLEGHGAIVAEGLTLGGAEDAWAQATGVATGGVDPDMVGDLAAGAWVPGAGALIRVAASGYRRRSALGDPALRHKATSLIARDATYMVGGATIGGTVGAFLGASLDVATLGMTGGGGMQVGGLLGSALGGMAGGDKARKEDRERVATAHAALSSSLHSYAAKLDAVSIEARRDWDDLVAELDYDAGRTAVGMKRRLAASTAAANNDLAALASISLSEAERFAEAIESALAVRRSTRRDRHLVRKLTRQLESAGCDANQGLRQDQIERAVVGVLRVKGTEGAVTDWLVSRAHRRSTILGALRAQQTAYSAAAVAQRRQAKQSLDARRSELRSDAALNLDKPLKRVQSTTTAFKREMKLQG